MTGAFSSSQASTIAWRSSILLTLKAPRAYLPLRALAKRSLVWVSGIVVLGCSIGHHTWPVWDNKNGERDWKLKFSRRGRLKCRDEGGVNCLKNFSQFC